MYPNISNEQTDLRHFVTVDAIVGPSDSVTSGAIVGRTDSAAKDCYFSNIEYTGMIFA